MNKPVTLIREELKRDIISTINKSDLPAFIVADILEKLLVECRQLEHQQYEQDKLNYEMGMKEKEEDD